jgi:hypothetical protein
LQVKSASAYDPLVLECVAFIHQQAIACNHYFKLSESCGASDNASRDYRRAMMQCRNTCLQSLHQLVARSSANIKSAAPDLRLSDDRSLMDADSDDSRTMPERLFDECVSIPLSSHLCSHTAAQVLRSERAIFQSCIQGLLAVLKIGDRVKSRVLPIVQKLCECLVQGAG